MKQLNPYQRYLATLKNKEVAQSQTQRKTESFYSKPTPQVIPEVSIEVKEPAEDPTENTEDPTDGDPDSVEYSTRRKRR